MVGLEIRTPLRSTLSDERLQRALRHRSRFLCMKLVQCRFPTALV